MQTDPMAQRKMITVRLSDDELALLRAVAGHYAHTVSGAIRMLAQREAEALGLDVKGGRKTRAKRK